MNVNQSLQNTAGKTGKQVAKQNRKDMNKLTVETSYDLEKMIGELEENLGITEEDSLDEITGTGSAGVYSAKMNYQEPSKKKDSKAINELEFELEDEEDENMDEITNTSSAGVYVGKAQFVDDNHFYKQDPVFKGGMTIKPNRNLQDPPKHHGQVGFKVMKKSGMNEGLDPKKLFDAETKTKILEYAKKNNIHPKFVVENIIKELKDRPYMANIIKENTKDYVSWEDYRFINEEETKRKNDGYGHKEIMDIYDDEGPFPEMYGQKSKVVAPKQIKKRIKYNELFDKEAHDKAMEDYTNGGQGNWEEYTVEPTDEQKKEMTKDTTGKPQPELRKKLDRIAKRTKQYKENRRKIYNIYGDDLTNN